MILEIRSTVPALPPAPIEFATLQLTPLADGQVSVVLTTTIFDAVEYELVNQHEVDERVGSLDGLVDFIKRHVQIRPATPLLS